MKIMPTQLPQKENTLFKRILKCYEQKQYKNGLKFCKQILSNPKFSEHGETLAMKGLTLNYLGRKDEAYDYVKRGLKNDLRSHVCWHVYGLLQRADHKYDEAIKCYRNALKWDKDNIQILRDLSLLQVQMRDTEGFRDTRYQLLKIRPAQRQSWIGYSISYYLLGDYDMAFTVMEEFRKTLFQDNQTKLDVEHSEMLFYQNMVLRDQEKYKESLDHLNNYQTKMADKLQIQEIKAMLHLKINELKQAEQIYKDLIKRNNENHAYYEGLEKCQALLVGVDQLSETDRLAIYLKYRKKYPRAEAPRALPLAFATGNAFKELVDDFLRIALKKGVPPLFTNLKLLYAIPEKAKIIEELVMGFATNLSTINKFAVTDDELQNPTVLLWTKFFLAQHFDYFRRTKIAMSYIDQVLEHTPTLIEGYVVKAKIFKHAGCLDDAAKWMDEGRSLDTADRFVNSKCAKYLLRINNVERAIEICGMFTKEGILPDEDLDSMQCMWFGIESAAAHKRKGEIGEALRKCHQIEKNFNEIVEDQFDFHTYCMRKVTLCAYIKLLKLEDVIRNHPFYYKGAKLAIECYIGLHDKPYTKSNDSNEAGKDNMTAQELKKLKSKQRRAQKKLKIEEEKKLAIESKEPKEAEGKKEEGKVKIVAEDLLQCEKPLDEALKFLIPLQLLAKERIETHLMAFEIFYRKERVLLMLQSIKRAAQCNSTHHLYHECLLKFLKYVQCNNANFSETVQQVLKLEISKLVTETDLFVYNQSYLESHCNSMKAHIAVGKSLYVLDEGEHVKALELITKLSDHFTDTNLQLCSAVHDHLLNGDYKASESDAQAYQKKCHELFPFAVKFKLSQSADITVEEKDTKECSPDIMEDTDGKS